MAEAVTAVAMANSARDAKQVRTVVWVMSLAARVFDSCSSATTRRLWRLPVAFLR